MRTRPHALLTVLASLALLVGCAGETVTGSSSSLVAAEQPLPSVARSTWEIAPAGCEGLVHSDSQFALADGEPSLLALFADESVVCVDAYSAIDEELRTQGIAADRLWLGYVAALQEIESVELVLEVDDGVDLEAVMGDPHPQPGDPITTTEVEQGDPHPQPGDGA